MSVKKPWYDSNLWLAVWLIFFPIVGWYGLWKNTTLSRMTKIIIIVVILALGGWGVTQRSGSSSEPQQTQEAPASDAGTQP